MCVCVCVYGWLCDMVVVGQLGTLTRSRSISEATCGENIWISICLGLHGNELFSYSKIIISMRANTLLATHFHIYVTSYIFCKKSEKDKKKSTVLKGTVWKKYVKRPLWSYSILCRVFPLQSLETVWATLAPGKNIPNIMCLWLCPRIGKNAHGCDFEPLGASRKAESRTYILAGLVLWA